MSKVFFCGTVEIHSLQSIGIRLIAISRLFSSGSGVGIYLVNTLSSIIIPSGKNQQVRAIAHYLLIKSHRNNFIFQLLISDNQHLKRL